MLKTPFVVAFPNSVEVPVMRIVPLLVNVRLARSNLVLLLKVISVPGSTVALFLNLKPELALVTPTVPVPLNVLPAVPANLTCPLEPPLIVPFKTRFRHCICLLVPMVSTPLVLIVKLLMGLLAVKLVVTVWPAHITTSSLTVGRVVAAAPPQPTVDQVAKAV